MTTLNLVQRRFGACLLAAIVFCATTVSLTAMTLFRSIKQLDNAHSLVRPSQLALSPSGLSFAVADAFANRIFVFNSPDQLDWVVGDISPLRLPTAVCFESEDVLLFAQQGDLSIRRVGRQDPHRIDSVAVISGGGVKSIDAIRKTADNQYIVLDRTNGRLALFDRKWRFTRMIADQGQGRGKIWAPADIAVQLGGSIAITDAASIPVQVFSSSGKFLVAGGWNNPTAETKWQAGAVALAQDETIWVANRTNLRWQIYDRSGTEIRREPFAIPAMHPTNAVFAADGRLIVVDEFGLIHIFEP